MSDRNNRGGELIDRLSKEEIENCQEIYQGLYKRFQEMGIDISMADAAFLRQMIREYYVDGKKLHDRSEDMGHPFDEPLADWLWYMYKINIEAFKKLIKEEYRGQAVVGLFKLLEKYREKSEYV